VTVLCFVLRCWLLTVFAFRLIWLAPKSDNIDVLRVAALTWKRFLELPGRPSSLFSPTLRDPSLMLVELAVNGSGAASFDSFYRYELHKFLDTKRQEEQHTFSHFLQTMIKVVHKANAIVAVPRGQRCQRWLTKQDPKPMRLLPLVLLTKGWRLD
jgi:hypothetical protein